jgi:hypothetical protein
MPHHPLAGLFTLGDPPPEPPLWRQAADAGRPGYPYAAAPVADLPAADLDLGSGLLWRAEPAAGRLALTNPSTVPRLAPLWLSRRLLRLEPGQMVDIDPTQPVEPGDSPAWWEAAGNPHRAAIGYRASDPAAMARLRLRHGNLASARRWAADDPPLLAALDQPPTLLATVETTAQALWQAEALLAAGRAAEAAALFQQPLQPSLGVPAGLLAWVVAWLRGDEPAWRWELDWGEGFAAGTVAIAALRYVVECHDDVLAHYHLGCALAGAGDWAAALNPWAVATDGPDAAAANRNLGLAAWRVLGDRAAAAAFYREALAGGGGPLTQAEYEQLSTDR